MSIVEIVCSSGAKYSLRPLTYRERKKVRREAMKVTMTMDENKKPVMQQEMDIYLLQEKMALLAIVGAPWLSEGKKIVIEDLDNILAEDEDELDKAIQDMNYPKKEVVEK